jgi:hypothetical protein
VRKAWRLLLEWRCEKSDEGKLPGVTEGEMSEGAADFVGRSEGVTQADGQMSDERAERQDEPKSDKNEKSDKSGGSDERKGMRAPAAPWRTGDKSERRAQSVTWSGAEGQVAMSVVPGHGPQ